MVDIKDGLMEQKHMTRSHQLGLCFTAFMSWPEITEYLHNLPTPRSPGKKTLFDVPLTGMLGPNRNWNQT